MAKFISVCVLIFSYYYMLFQVNDPQDMWVLKAFIGLMLLTYFIIELRSSLQAKIIQTLEEIIKQLEQQIKLYKALKDAEKS